MHSRCADPRNTLLAEAASDGNTAKSLQLTPSRLKILVRVGLTNYPLVLTAVAPDGDTTLLTTDSRRVRRRTRCRWNLMESSDPKASTRREKPHQCAVPGFFATVRGPMTGRTVGGLRATTRGTGDRERLCERWGIQTHRSRRAPRPRSGCSTSRSGEPVTAAKAAPRPNNDKSSRDLDLTAVCSVPGPLRRRGGRRSWTQKNQRPILDDTSTAAMMRRSSVAWLGSAAV